MNIIITISANSESFQEKYGWNGVLSMFGLFLVGFDDPVMWRAIKCTITIAVRTNGNRKWSMKNRDKVAWLIENPPHNH